MFNRVERDPVKAALKKQKEEDDARRLWINSNDAVNRTYMQDPRTAIGNDAMAAGSDMSPVSGIAAGLARVGQGVMGGLINKEQRAKYGGNEAQLQGSIQGALASTLPGIGSGGTTAGGIANAAAVQNVAGGGNALQAGPGGSVMPSAPPPGPIANVAAALTPQVTPAGTAATPLASAPFPVNRPATVRRMAAEGGGVVGGQAAMTPTTPMAPATAMDPRVSIGAGRATKEQLLNNPAVSRRSAVAAGIPRTRRGTIEGRDPVLAPKAEGTGGLFSSDPEAVPANGYGGRDDPAGPYGAVVGYGNYGRPQKSLVHMTFGEVRDFGDNTLIPNTMGRAELGLPANKGSSAAGAFQTTGDTIDQYAPIVLGKNWKSQDYSAENQDRVNKAIFEDRKKGNLKDTWTSLPDPTPGAYSQYTWEQMKPVLMRGESGGGGGAGTTGGVDEYGNPIEARDYSPATPGAPNVNVAPLPPPPVMPDRPSFLPKPDSTRYNVAMNLVQQGQNGQLGPGQLGAAMQQINKDFGPSFDDLQAINMQRDAQESGLTRDRDQQQMSNWSQQDVARNAQQLGATTSDQELRRNMVRDQYQGEIARNTRDDTQQADRLAAQRLAQSELEQQRLKNQKDQMDYDSKLALYKAELAAKGKQKAMDYFNTGEGRKDYIANQKSQSDGLSMASNADRILGVIGQMDAKGITYSGLGAEARSHYDQGVATLQALHREMVKQALGGKFGGGVSNTDADMIAKSLPVGPGYPAPVVREFANRIKQVGKRQYDYHSHYLSANSDEGVDVFARRWSKFINEAQLFDKNGRPYANYLDYDHWLDDAIANHRVK